MKLNLVVLTAGKSQGKKIPIDRTPFIIGRDPKCHLRPASPMVSGQHCMIQVRQGKIYVSDRGSTNGTFVNEVRLQAECALHHDDHLRVGPLAFGVSLEYSTPVDQPTPLPPSRARVEVVDDEAVAAALFAAQDDDMPAQVNATLDSQPIPTGTTILQTLAPDQPPTNGANSETDKPAPEKAPPAKVPVANTASAAEELLNKYLRRPRKAN